MKELIEAFDTDRLAVLRARYITALQAVATNPQERSWTHGTNWVEHYKKWGQETLADMDLALAQTASQEPVEVVAPAGRPPI